MTIALASLDFRNPEPDGIRQRKLNDLTAHVRTARAVTDNANIALLAGGVFGNYANDAAAAAGGVAVGHFYRNGSIVMIRVA